LTVCRKARQWERLAEIQQIQIDIMRDLGRRREPS
jgi:hypothetical protein